MGEFVYYLMHKDIPVSMLSFNESGNLVHSSQKRINPEHVPIMCIEQHVGLDEWWNGRSVPRTRDNLRQMLASKGCAIREEYLFKNLGLSLTDCYWIKPIESDLFWNDVNLFTNPFKDDSLKFDKSDNDSLGYSPNSSLPGNVEKTWAIKNNERFLIKGNRTDRSAESLNEVLAAAIHKMQGHECAEYELLHISDKTYDYGCITRIFTSEDAELVSAYELLRSSDTYGHYYDNLRRLCGQYGMDREQIAAGLDYLILTDYIMSQEDRHFNNIGFIRNPDTLQFSGMAPIYDSGNSMYFDSIAPKTTDDLSRLCTKGIADNIEHSLKYVKDASVIDLTKLPSVSFIKELYAKDSKADEKHTEEICYAYERRIDRCRNLQLGISPSKPFYFPVPAKDKDLVNAFADDYGLESLMKSCRQEYGLSVRQAKNGLDELSAQSQNDAMDIMGKMTRLFEGKGFSETDLYKYIELMNITGLPDISVQDKNKRKKAGGEGGDDGTQDGTESFNDASGNKTDSDKDADDITIRDATQTDAVPDECKNGTSSSDVREVKEECDMEEREDI